jgi:Heterokaryon incompatibility protein (HET)
MSSVWHCEWEAEGHEGCPRVGAKAGRGGAEPCIWAELYLLYLEFLLQPLIIHHHNLQTASARIPNNLIYHFAKTSIRMNPYQYSPLRKDRDEFRLIRLVPGPTSAEIEIEIFHAPRSSSYEALSYVWGPPERTHVALVHGPVTKRNEDPSFRTTIGITHSLAVAFSHLRDPTKPRVLWIDAICINQDDSAERSAEVLEMGSIYSRARQVIVWLGPSSANSRLAIETLSRLAEGIIDHKENRSVELKADSWTAFLHSNSEALTSNASSWFAIRDLLRRKWFSRLWVFQEITLATKAIVFVGQDSLDWKLFTTALQWLWAIFGQLNQLFDDLNIEDFVHNGISGFLLSSPEYLNRQGGIGLDDLLDRTLSLDCFDPRDRLYAIRSLAYPAERELIIPDYSLSVGEVFKYYTLRRIRAFGNGVSILTRCLLRDTSSIPKMPSWVPDFSSTNNPSTLFAFPAAGRSTFDGAVTNDQLTVQAVKLATITSLLYTLEPSYTNLEIIEVFRSLEKSIPSSVYAGGGSTSDAFIDAIVFGERAELMPRARGYFPSLEEYRRVLEDSEVEVEHRGEEIQKIVARFMEVAQTRFRERCFFNTQEGFFGVCPESARHGDVVVVALGIKLPLVLRPVTHQGKSCYLVVGACYVSGAMHTELLLGPIPIGWNLSYKIIDGTIRQVFADGKMVTQEDPRLPLPPGWRYRYGSWEAFQQHTEEEALKAGMWFENVETKEISWYDPRLTPEALRERGVDLQEFVLV